MLSLNRNKTVNRNVSKEDGAKTAEDLVEEQYSTVSECAGILTPDAASGEPAASPQDRSSEMVACDLYAPSADAPEGGATPAMPDISPYACFYGASGPPVLKVGWLDKLSPQG